MCYAGFVGHIVGKLRQGKSHDFQDGPAPPPRVGQQARLLSTEYEVGSNWLWAQSA